MTSPVVQAPSPEELNVEPTSSHDKTQLNPIAQKEIEKMRREIQDEERRRIEAAIQLAEEEAVLEAKEPEPVQEVIRDESTQVLRLDHIKNELMVVAEEEEENIEKQLVAIQKRQKAEDDLEDEEKNEDDEEKKKKRLKFIVIAASAIILLAILFPSDDKPDRPPFQHLPPQIIFPIPFDKADSKRAIIELEKGKELFAKGTYPNIVKAGLLFKSSYENNLNSDDSLNLMVRSYSEQIKHSKQFAVDSQTLFNIIQSKRPP